MDQQGRAAAEASEPASNRSRSPRPGHVEFVRARYKRLELATKVAEIRYAADLRSLFRALHQACMQAVRPYLTYMAQARNRYDAQTRWGTHVKELVRHFVIQVADKVQPMFERMYRGVFSSTKAAMDSVFGESRKADAVHLERQYKRESERLVEKAAEDYGRDFIETFDTLDNSSLTAEELEADLEQRGTVSESRASLIARDQAIKLNAALMQERQQSEGYDFYWWLTCRDDRVRPTHRDNDAVVFAWTNPSEITGHPGHDPMCRCLAIPYDGDLEPGDSVPA